LTRRRALGNQLVTYLEDRVAHHEAKPKITYDIYIGAPAAKVWNGRVDGSMTEHYVYGTRLETKLAKGSPFAHVGEGNFNVVSGEILDVEPGRRAKPRPTRALSKVGR